MIPRISLHFLHLHQLPRLLRLPFLLLLLSSCSHLQPDDGTRAHLTRDTRIVLPSPALETPLNRHQLLRVETGDLRESFQVLLEASGEQVELVALSPVGARLFSLRYDGERIDTEQLALDDRLPPPAQILADVMLAYWPVASWQDSLPASWTLADEGLQRLLRDASGSRIVEIQYRQEGDDREPERLIQHHFDYRIHIRRLD